MKKHTPRWVRASVLKHFNDTLSSSFKIFIEGMHRDAKDLAQHHIELRMDGPRLRETSNKEYQVWVSVNVLLKDNQDRNLYTQDIVAGEVLEAFTRCIQVYKYGDGPDDDDSLYFSLVLQDNPRGVNYNRFGQIEKHTKVDQATIEGHYVGYVTIP